MAMRLLAALCSAAAAGAIEKPACALQSVVEVAETSTPRELTDAVFGGGFVLELDLTVTAKPDWSGGTVFEADRSNDASVSVSDDLSAVANVKVGSKTTVFGSGSLTPLQLNTRATLTVTAVPSAAGAADGKCHFYLNGVRGSSIDCPMLPTESRRMFVGRDRLGISTLTGTVHSVRLQACDVPPPAPVPSSPAPSSTPSPRGCVLRDVFDLRDVAVPQALPLTYFGGQFELQLDVVVGNNTAYQHVFNSDAVGLWFSTSTFSSSVYLTHGKHTAVGHVNLEVGQAVKMEVGTEWNKVGSGWLCWLDVGGQRFTTDCTLPEAKNYEVTIGAASRFSTDAFSGAVRRAQLRACDVAPPAEPLQSVFNLTNATATRFAATFGGPFVFEAEVTAPPAGHVQEVVSSDAFDVEFTTDNSLFVRLSGGSVLLSGSPKVAVGERLLISLTAASSPVGPGGVCTLRANGRVLDTEECALPEMVSRVVHVGEEKGERSTFKGKLIAVRLQARDFQPETPAPPTPAPPVSSSGSAWWVWLVVACGVCAVGVGAGAVFLARRRRSANEPQAQEMLTAE